MGGIKQSVEKIGLATDDDGHDDRCFFSSVWKKDLRPCVPTRYLIVLCCFLLVSDLYALRAALSIAIVAMVKDSGATISSNTKVYNWNSAEQGLILAAFSYGYIWLRLLGGLLADRFGAKYVLAIGILMSSVFNLLIPLAAAVGVWCLVLVRILAGLVEGPIMPAVYALLGKWATKHERTRMVAIVLAGDYLGNFIASIMSAVIIVYGGGWSNVFYIFGSIGILLFILLIFLVYDSPATHPCISTEERHYIESSINNHETISLWSVPLKHILTSRPVWALTIVCFSSTYGYALMQTTLPTYFQLVLDFDLRKGLITNGIFTSVPYAIKFLVALIAGPSADYLIAHYFSTTATRKVFCWLASGSSALFLLLCGFFGELSKWIVFTCMVLTVGVNGFEVASHLCNNIDIASSYAGFIYGLVSAFSTIAAIMAPQISRVIASSDASAPHAVLIREWRNVLIVAAEIYLFGAIAYTMLGSGETQPWAIVKKHDSKE